MGETQCSLHKQKPKVQFYKQCCTKLPSSPCIPSSWKVSRAAAAAAAVDTIEPLLEAASGHQHGSGQGGQEGLHGHMA